MIVRYRASTKLQQIRDTTRKGPLAFVFEYIFYAVIIIIALPRYLVPRALLLGSIFHLINANSFFGFTRKNPFKTTTSYALLALTGFVLFIFFASRRWK